MTDVAEPRTERARLFSGRLEAARTHPAIKWPAFLAVGILTWIAAEFLSARWPVEPNTLTAYAAFVGVSLLVGLPWAITIVVLHFGYRPVGLTQPLRPWSIWTLLVIAMFTLSLGHSIYYGVTSVLNGYPFWRPIFLPLFFGNVIGLLLLETLRARGWRWRR
jgi:hypothetical protein